MLNERDNEPVVIPAELRAAYEATNYDVETGDGIVTLRVGRPVPARMLGLRPDWTRLAVVTAYNPFSNALSDADNAERHQRLLHAVIAAGHAVLTALGTGESDKWRPEVSLAIFDPSDDELDDWMVEFGQNAIVVAERSGTVALRFHPHEVTRMAQAAGCGAVRS
jgi:hypothetical protein